MSQYYPDTDFTGSPRVVDERIDLGAIEFPIPNGVEETAVQSCVYPNPGKDVLNIEVRDAADRVEVYDLTGRKVFENKIFGNQIAINTEAWPSGMYFWKIYSTSGSTALIKTGKWIKE